MVVTDCEINVQSYIPYHAPVAHMYTLYLTNCSTCSHHIRNIAPARHSIYCVNSYFCGQSLKLAFNLKTFKKRCSRWFDDGKGGRAYLCKANFFSVLEKCCLSP